MWVLTCAPEGTRTPSLLIRSQTLYPFELRAQHAGTRYSDGAEEAGFEPARELSPPTRLAGGRTRPNYATPPRTNDCTARYGVNSSLSTIVPVA